MVPHSPACQSHICVWMFPRYGVRYHVDVDGLLTWRSVCVIPQEEQRPKNPSPIRLEHFLSFVRRTTLRTLSPTGDSKSFPSSLRKVGDFPVQLDLKYFCPSSRTTISKTLPVLKWLLVLLPSCFCIVLCSVLCAKFLYHGKMRVLMPLESVD